MVARLVMVTMIAIAVIGLDIAEARGGRGHGRGPRGEDRARAALDLSEDQKAQLQSLRKQHRAEMRELRASGDASREHILALREQRRAAFDAVLTNEQRATLEEHRASRRGGFSKRGWLGGQGLDSTGDVPKLPASALNTDESTPTAVEQATWGQIKAAED